MANRPAPAADVERWMDWQLTTLSAPGWTIFLGLVLTKPEQRDMAAIAAATKRFNELWTIVDQVLATRKFVAGGQLTIGDIPCTDRSLGGEDWTVYQGPVPDPGQPPCRSK